MMRDYRFPVFPLLLCVITSITTQAVLAAALEEQDSQAAPLDCVINPSVVADLGSGVPGILSEVNVDRSDFIEAGEVVAQLESRVEVAARDLARVRAEKDTEVKLRRVNAAFGQRQHKRTQNLFARKVVSTNDMDERKTEAQIASIQLRQAMDNKEIASLELVRSEEVLKRRTIKSPISGVVMDRFKTIGEYVDEQPVLRVAQLDPLHVEVFVPVEQLGDIRPGMRAEVWSDAVNGTAWNAKVTRVDKVADVASGTYGVRLELPNPDYVVPAGLRCRLAFKSQPELPVVDQPAPSDSKQVVAERPVKDVTIVKADTLSEAEGVGKPKKPAREKVPEKVAERPADKVGDEPTSKPVVAAAPAIVLQPRLVKNGAKAAGMIVDEKPKRASSKQAPASTLVTEKPPVVSAAEETVVAAGREAPASAPPVEDTEVRKSEKPKSRGIFDKIIAAVTDEPEAKTEERPLDADRGEQRADSESEILPGVVNKQPRQVNTSDALVGRLGGVAPIVRNERSAEVNTRDALTGRINLDLPVEVADEAASVCISAGPYDSEAIATAQARRLRDAGLSVDVKTETASVGIGYRVVSAPLDKRSDARALISRLKQSGVKDYFVAGSERTSFRVMLGSFSSANGAKRRIKQMEQLGIEAQRQRWNRDVAVYKLLVFGKPTADAEPLLAQLPSPSENTPPAHCEQFAAR